MPTHRGKWILVLTIVCRSAIAQTGDGRSDEVEGWIKRLWTETHDYEPSRSVEIRWTSSVNAVSAETLARWKTEIEGKPDHPRRLEISTQERRLRDGPDKVGVVLRYADASLWRQSEDHLYNPTLLFSDSAFDGTVCWLLNRESL